MKPREIREFRPEDRDGLWKMYADFDPLGVAQGVPPVDSHARERWIDGLLDAGLNLIACTRDHRVHGHVILAPSGPAEAEIAFFVHQNHRRNRLGTKLVAAALQRAPAMQVRRVWATVLADNLPALRLLRGQGFVPCEQSFPSLELELLLPPPKALPHDSPAASVRRR